jgi:hypothetical protein
MTQIFLEHQKENRKSKNIFLITSYIAHKLYQNEQIKYVNLHFLFDIKETI